MQASIKSFEDSILPIPLILIGFVTVTSAQHFDTVPPALPPEIMADRYLVKAEQLEAGKDFAGALKAMDEVFAMQQEHDLKLPDDIVYKFARIAMSADSVRIALASVNTYLVAAGKEGEFYKEALALSLLAEEELEVPEILPDDTCAGKEEGAACWMELANHPDCYVWEQYLWYSSVTWSGATLGKVGRGEGTLTWTRGDRENSHSGRLRRGKYHGRWIERRSGYVSQGPYVDGARHGSWVEHIASNSKEKGGYMHGKREGPWLKYFEWDEKSCTSIVYREGEEISSRNVDLGKCEGW